MIPGKMELYTKPRDNAGLPAYAPGAHPGRTCSQAIGVPQEPRRLQPNPSHYGCLQAGKNLVDPLTATICSVFPFARSVAGNGT